MTLAERVRNGDFAGLCLRDISRGETLFVQTLNSRYSITYLGRGAAKIAGNPAVCEGSEPVNILGSTCGGDELWAAFIGVGMCLQFQRPGDRRVTTTSPIQALARVGKASLGPESAAPAASEGRWLTEMADIRNQDC